MGSLTLPSTCILMLALARGVGRRLSHQKVISQISFPAYQLIVYGF